MDDVNDVSETPDAAGQVETPRMSPISPPEEESVAVPDWQDMSVADTVPITLESPVIVVVPVGHVGCGKTTLVTTIYDQFLLGPYAGWLFGGSSSLLGFERRSWDSRTASRRSVAEMERTKVREGERFLHLRLQDEGQQQAPKNLLIVDASGELFQRLADNPDEPPDLASLRRADIIAILVDGEQLADPKLGRAAMHDARMLLRAIVEKGLAPATARLQVVVTKWDLIDAAGIGRDELMRGINQAILRGQGGIGAIEVLITAARPLPQKVPWAFGCAALLGSWLVEPESPEPAAISRPDSKRQFDRFAKNWNAADK